VQERKEHNLHQPHTLLVTKTSSEKLFENGILKGFTDEG
jgi:hypothetical protein